MFFSLLHGSTVFLVKIPVPKHVFVDLREELRNGHMIAVTPVLFNIGINENATLAEKQVIPMLCLFKFLGI